MKNFKEIAEKCLKGELSGIFTCDLNGEIIKVPSKNLSKNINSYELKYPYPHTYDHYDSNGISIPSGYNVVINFIPDMKNDKRNIQISLYQAREWYSSGNDTLKTLALSSFSKEELDPYPRSWEEWKKLHPNNHLIIQAPGKEFCDKLIAYSAVLLLREEWIHIWSKEQGLEEDWKSDYNDFSQHKYYIYFEHDMILIGWTSNITEPLSFPTRELTENFLNTFKFLLERAKGLY